MGPAPTELVPPRPDGTGPPPRRRLTGLARLLGTEDVDASFRSVWERQPRLVRASFDPAEPLLSRQSFEFLVSSPHDGDHVSIIEGNVARPVASYHGTSASGAVYRAYAGGGSLLATGLRHRHEAIARLCADVEGDLRFLGVPMVDDVGANAYLTPPWAQGFGAHYDDHCAFVVQLAGRKEWAVFAPLEEVPLDPCPATLAADELGDPVLEASLEPGDVLYLPRGFPHLAWCRDADSLHVTLSVRAMTWAHAVGALCRSQPPLRRSIGPLRSDGGEAAASHYARTVRPAVERLGMANFLRDALDADGDHYPGGGHLDAIAATRKLGPGTWLERVPGVGCVALEDDADAVLRFGTTVLRLPVAMAPVFRFLAAADRFPISQLPAIERSYDPVELAGILLERGLLQRAAATPAPGPEAEARAQAPTVDPAGEPPPHPTPSRGLATVQVVHRGGPPAAPGLEWVACAERLSPGDCDELVAACSAFPELPPTTVGEDRYPAHRQAVMRKVDLTARTAWIFDLVRDVAAEAARSYFDLELTSIIRAPQYVEYTPGRGHFRRHNDYSHDQAVTPRKLTVIVQLSDPADYGGGRLRVFGNEVEDLPDERGTIVALPSFVFHEVTPVEHGVRRALVAWVAGPRLR